MKRFVCVLAVGLFLCAATSATAGPKPKPRSEVLKYDQPAVGVFTPVVHSWYFDCLERDGCVLINIQRGDRTLSIRFADATGLPVYGQLRNPNGSGGDVVAHIYEETERPLMVRGPAILALHILGGIAPNGQPSTPTMGDVHLTFNES